MDRCALVVEDDAFTRTLVREVLQASAFTVLEADSAATALKAIDRHDPDCLVIDVDLGLGPTGLDLIDALGDRRPQFGILVLSNYPAQSAQRLGASGQPAIGHLPKASITEPGLLVRALEAVLQDQAVTDARAAAPATGIENLTPHQLELLRLIALGMSNEAIAREKGVSVRSVESLTSRLFASLGLGRDPQISARVRASMIYVRHMGIPSQP